MDGPPVTSLDIINKGNNGSLEQLIPRKPTPVKTTTEPVNGTSNGATNGLSGVKRSALDLGDLSPSLPKRTKTQENGAAETNGDMIEKEANEPILVEDSGAILIDDD